MFNAATQLHEFEHLIKILSKCSEYILSAFDCGYTNGFTEGCNKNQGHQTHSLRLSQLQQYVPAHIAERKRNVTCAPRGTGYVNSFYALNVNC
ncbi:MAG: transposase [Clostridia bacterium]|nr:transposase [Clostridia bacterium]